MDEQTTCYDLPATAWAEATVSLSAIAAAPPALSTCSVLARLASFFAAAGGLYKWHLVRIAAKDV